MPRVRELPPVPDNPIVSPPVTIPGEEDVVIPNIDSLAAGAPRLEAKLRRAAAPQRAVLLCHPHPLYGGTMHSAVPLAITKVLAERGGDRVTTLRFNYRGVGASEGRYDGGRGETDDARAAFRFLKSHIPGSGVPVTLCGYSFGTWVGLRAAVLEGGVERVTLVAPAVRIFDFIVDDGLAFQGRLNIFVGDNDEFCDVDEAKELAASLGASLRVIEGADHYFMKSRRKLAEEVVPGLAPEIRGRAP
jgi:alpha/beta superfamily hydrolase